ncbi:MAG TPA: sialate O-acetylesterase [Rectinemataceae bacterium]
MVLVSLMAAMLLAACAFPGAEADLGLGYRIPQPGDPYFGTTSSVDVFILAGQSNGVGAGDPALAPMNEAEAFISYDSQNGGWKPQSMANPALNYGSLAPAFANEYHKLTGRTAAFIQTSVGGTALYLDPVPGKANWSPNGTLRDRAAAIAKDGLVTLAYNGVSYAVKGVIWVQGESDAIIMAQGLETAGEFEERLREVIAFFRQNFGSSLTFGVVRTGTLVGADDTCFALVRGVQDKVCGDSVGVPMLYSETDQFPDRGWMVDVVHYNQTGLDAIGRAAASIFAAL